MKDKIQIDADLENRTVKINQVTSWVAKSPNPRLIDDKVCFYVSGDNEDYAPRIMYTGKDKAGRRYFFLKVVVQEKDISKYREDLNKFKIDDHDTITLDAITRAQSLDSDRVWFAIKGESRSRSCDLINEKGQKYFWLKVLV